MDIFFKQKWNKENDVYEQADVVDGIKQIFLHELQMRMRLTVFHTC
jgi:hypothetical protein